MLPLLDAGPISSLDAAIADAGPEPEPEPEPPPLVARPVVVDDPASELERVGVDGGDPRLGRCRGGVATGIRPTANPSEEVFGQRITFLEPVCGRVSKDPSTASLTMTRDESLLDWDATGEFLGPPLTEVPDERLIWEVQPPTLCPETAPVLVGLSGDYDPEAPGNPDTSAFRSLVIECAPLLLAPNGIDVGASGSGHVFLARADSFATDGTDFYQSFCEGGTVITQIHVSAGFWLDGFVLGCSSLRSPNLAGEPCAGERDCQSAVCVADGTCAP
jgi:hypothetical protein